LPKSSCSRAGQERPIHSMLLTQEQQHCLRRSTWAAHSVRTDDFDLIVNPHFQTFQRLLDELLQVERGELTAQDQALPGPFDVNCPAMMVKMGM